MPLKFAPYSFSKITTFTQCPKKFKFKYIDKIYFKSDNIALEKGSYIHLLLEILANPSFADSRKIDIVSTAMHVINKTQFKFSLSTEQDIKSHQKIFLNFIQSDIGHKYFIDYDIISAEEEFGIKWDNNNFDATSYYNKSATIRGKVDQISKNGNEIHIIDWKSGKVPQEISEMQIQLYAIWFFLKFKNIDKVITSFVYIEHNKEKTVVYKRDDIPLIKKAYGRRIKEIEIENSFNKKETHMCNWCEYRNKGLCDELSSFKNIKLQTQNSQNKRL